MSLTAIIEAFLIASDEALPTSELARLIRVRVAEAEEELLAEAKDDGKEAESVALPEELQSLADITEEVVLAALSELNEHYEESQRSFRALERAKGWKIYTTSDYGEFVKLLFPSQKPKRLSAPAMETLAVVAYRQPVTKSAIDAVRGVSSDGMLQKLLDAELVKIAGRADLPGRPLLYETTDTFFEHFGIKSPDELPNALELRRMELPEPEGEEEPEEGSPQEVTTDQESLDASGSTTTENESGSEESSQSEASKDKSQPEENSLF